MKLLGDSSDGVFSWGWGWGLGINEREGGGVGDSSDGVMRGGGCEGFCEPIYEN